MPELLRVEDLRVEYRTRGRRGAPFVAVQEVGFTIAPGETVALVGESGSGKTTIGKAVLGLERPAAGTIEVDGVSAVGLSAGRRRRLARDLQVVFQDPYSSLNPALTIARTLTEPLRAQGGFSRSKADQDVRDLLARVGLPVDAADRYPAHFSGGQRQRIAIARALSVGPRLVVCDEPTSALDVSTQRTVLDLLAELQRERSLGYLFITHDLAVVREFADRVLVLKDGRIVESGDAAQVCERPAHPYTQALVAAAPVPDPVIQRARRTQWLDRRRGAAEAA